MASSLFESFTGGIELNDVISCVWCKRQQLTQLVQLGCFHLSCKACLKRKLEDPRPGTEFNCPECDMSCMVPMGGVDTFPDEPLQHKMNQITAIFSNNKPNCKLCEQVNAVSSTSSVCITCKINLCERDAKCHQVTPGHKVITHEELCVEPNLSLMLKSKVNICQEHSFQKTYFCKRCQYQICPECAMSNHSDHKKDSVKNIATEYRKILEENIGEIKITERKAKENIQKLEKLLAEIREKYREARIKENRQKIEKEEKIKKKQVNFEISEDKNKIKLCKSAESYIKVFLKFSADSDVIEKYREILVNFDNCEIIGEYQGACSLSEKMQGIGLNENVKETKGIERKRLSGLEKKVSESKEIEKKRLSGLEKKVSESKEIERKRLSGLELEAKWKDDFWYGLSVYKDEFLVVKGQRIKWVTMDGKCKREIESVDLGDARDVEVYEGEVYVSDRVKKAVIVFDRDWNMNRKLFLPESENGLRNSLSLAVDKSYKDIYVSSTRTNTVYKYDTGRGKFTPWITNGLNGPHYLCVTPDHHLVVSNYGSHTVMKFNPQSKLVWSYGSEGSGKGQLSCPYGVTSDPWGHIFIADFNNDRIVVVSSDGQHLFEEGIECPLAVIFGNGRLVVTTSSQIYVTKGKYS